MQRKETKMEKEEPENPPAEKKNKVEFKICAVHTVMGQPILLWIGPELPNCACAEETEIDTRD